VNREIFKTLALSAATGMCFVAAVVGSEAQAPATDQHALVFDAVSVRPARHERGLSTRTFSDPGVLRMKPRVSQHAHRIRLPA
jgi:hypothetical protein